MKQHLNMSNLWYDLWDRNSNAAHETNFFNSLPSPQPRFQCAKLRAHSTLHFAYAVFWCCRVGLGALNCARLSSHPLLREFLSVIPCFLVNTVLAQMRRWECRVGEAGMEKGRSYLVLLPKPCCVLWPHLLGKTLSIAAYPICFWRFLK